MTLQIIQIIKMPGYESCKMFVKLTPDQRINDIDNAQNTFIGQLSVDKHLHGILA